MYNQQVYITKQLKLPCLRQTTCLYNVLTPHQHL